MYRFSPLLVFFMKLTVNKYQAWVKKYEKHRRILFTFVQLYAGLFFYGTTGMFLDVV